MARPNSLLLGIALAAAIGGAPSPASDTPAQAVAGPAAALGSAEISADPFPIHRIRATEGQLADLLKRLDAGPLVRLPRSEFESRARAAGRAIAEAKLLPRITDTRFKAALIGSDLVGTAEFDIVNSATGPRYLPLDPLRLALGSATWGDGREAVVGIPPGGAAAAVWVDRPGRQTLKFTWSLTGIAELGERHFELRAPTAATASLTLELPDQQVPTASAADALLTGPFPLAGNPPRAEWRFRFGARPRLDFAVRDAGNPGAAAAAALVATYDISPGQLTCRFEYDLRPAKGTIGDWAFTVDAGLHVTDVVVNNRAGWTIDPPTAPGQSRALRVALHQPGAGGKVLVSAVAPFPDSRRSPDGRLPAVRPISANLDDETITIRLAPGLKPENWQAGDYRITDAQVLADQSRSISLTGTLLPAGADRAFRLMPALSAASAAADFVTTEVLAWRFDADRASTSLRVGARVRRGALFQFALRLPAGYGSVQVNSVPDDLVAHHATTGGVLTVEFAHPLLAGQSAELLFEFGGPPLASAPMALPFPAFVPLGAAERSGVLAIIPGPLWTVDPAPGAGARQAAWFDISEPTIPPDAAAAYYYRGANADGMVNLTPIRAAFSADVATNTVPPRGGFSHTTVQLRVRTGGLTTLMIREHEGVAPRRTWRVVGGGNAIKAVVALPVSSLLNPLALLGRPAAPGEKEKEPGRIWLIQFVRPVMGDVTLETVAPREPPSGQIADGALEWSVPGATPDPNAPPPTSRAGPRAIPSPQWAFSELYLVTAVRSPSDVVVVFGGTVDSSAGTSLPLRLPPGANVRGVSVGGKWLEAGGCRLSEDGMLRVPSAGGGPARFEVRYRLPVEAHGPFGHVRSPEPGLPVEGSAIRRWWVFATDVLPGWPVLAWDRGSAVDLPKFLGDSPATWAGGLVVSRTAVEELRVGTARVANAVGFAIAAGLFALIWAAARRGHPFCAVLTVAVVLALGGANLLGPPWWQRAAAIPLLVGLAAAAGMVVVRGRRAAGLAAVAMALVAFINLETRAQAPTPALVVILPPGVQGREVVLAPKSVLDRLVVVPQSPGVVLSASAYSIEADDAGARVVAKYTAHALGDGEAVATLPLADARLEKVIVNKAAAFPTEPRPGVYAVPLLGKGRHEIEVSFIVPLGGMGTERDLRFGVPECPTTHLTADLPGAARQAQVVGRVGRRTAVDGERVKLEADVGAVKTLHVRWREGTAGTASVKVREGCIWDVSEAGAELTACYLVRVEQGTVGALQFNLPEELDPLAVTLRPLDLNGAAALRDWTLGKKDGTFRLLRIDFQAPAAGRLLVVLTCAPRKAITRQPLLRFPKPIVPRGSVEPDAAYALRANGVVVEEPGRSGVIDFAPDALIPDFGRVDELWRNPNAPIRVFRPTAGGTAELRPTLRVAIEPPGATLETVWHVGPKRAQATGVLRWNGKTAPEMVEFTLPSAKMLEVRGAEVASWDQTGARVQVWLRRPTKEGELEWIATAVIGAAPFDAQAPRPVSLHLLGDTVRLRAAEGYAIHVERDRGWTALDGPGNEHAFSTTNAAAPPVRVRLTPVPRPERVKGVIPVQPIRPPQPTTDVLGPPPAPIATTPAARASGAALPDAPRWVWPVSAAAGWVVASLVLAMLLVRLPHATWPEQFGLVAGLLGAALTGGWWIGVAAWALARLAWLIGYRSAPSARPTAVRL